MSEVKVNKISPRTNCGTVQLGDSGDTITIPAGATITNNGTQTGFGRTGTVDWQTGSIKTANFTAANGEGYFCNTSGGGFTATLPASPSAGDIVSFSDYTRTFQTNALIIGRNSEPIGGVAADAVLNTEGQTATFVYVDGTEGWINIQETSNSVTGDTFLVATGGTETTCGNYKIHTFTGPGTFTVSKVSNTAAENIVSYLVVAGGGGAKGDYGGGGGAGGFREYKGPADCYTASPLNGNPGGTAVTVTAQAYPITVGGGGTAPGVPSARGCSGANSVFSTITSTGGGGAGAGASPAPVPDGDGRAGGSGGGGGGYGPGTRPGGAGNTPPVTPAQGKNGGQTTGSPGAGYSSAGGGGATAVGSNVANPGSAGPQGGNGGAGATTSITGSPVAYAGGGGGGGWDANGGTGGTGGGGNGGRNNGSPSAQDGTANTGGGAGGGAAGSPGNAINNGGSGIVVIRYKFQ